jgi:hypothetical protein
MKYTHNTIRRGVHDAILGGIVSRGSLPAAM